jgi:DNA-binding MarR family transcriptional regulator
MSTQVPHHDETAADAPAVLAWTRLRRAATSTSRLLSATLLAEHGLAQTPGRRLRRVDLARELLLTPSGVTRLLEGLEEAGLVERAPSAADLRITYAVLTDTGAATLRRASCGHVGSIRALLEDHLSPEEIEELAALLGRLPGVAACDASAAAEACDTGDGCG